MAGTQILSEIIADQRAWTAQTIDSGESWRYALTPECFVELDSFLAQWRRQSQPITGTRVESADFPACAAVLEGALDALERGRGFAIVERLSFERYTRDEAQMVYWVIGQLLGVPFAQDVKGTLLYDVRDTGQDPTKGARFSVSNVESSFHMDHCFGDPIPDILGLLSLQGAKSGGRSQFLSAYTLHNELLTRYPQEVATLYEPFYFDRRGQFKEGEKPVFEAPIFRWDAQGLHIRYLYYYIQVGQERMEESFSPAQARALEAVEDTLRRQDLHVELLLEPGQMLFTSNHWLLHNRTSFEDFPEPEKRRHLVRLWLSYRNGAVVHN